MLTIISITKNDLDGIKRTLKSTKLLRELNYVRQIVIDSSYINIQKELTEIINDEINIKYYWQKPEGVTKAFNYGISLAEESWLWFLNGGDEVHYDLNIELFTKILEYSSADVMIFSLEYHDGQVSIRPPMPFLWPPVVNWIPHPATIIRKEVIQKFNGFNEGFAIAMDNELWMRLFSSDIVTDMISIKIAKFAIAGLSGDVPKTACEVKQIIKLHRKIILKNWLKSALMILRAWHTFKKLSSQVSNSM